MNLNPAFSRLLSAVATLIAPPACCLCERLITVPGFCSDCRPLLQPASPLACPICARPGAVCAPCGQCLMVTPAFSRTFAAFTWEAPLRELVHGFKYAGRLDIGAGLAAELVHHASSNCRQDFQPDCIIPVPLSPQRLRGRGFNQAVELAMPSARRLKTSVYTRSVIRSRDTSPQTALRTNARIANVRNAFQVLRDLNGARVLVVDDVMTTGATVNALALACRSAGAAEVQVQVLARATALPGIGVLTSRQPPKAPVARQSAHRSQGLD